MGENVDRRHQPPGGDRLKQCLLINQPGGKPLGAGEATTRPVAAAIGNAIFDATGVRLRKAPFNADRVKAALGMHA